MNEKDSIASGYRASALRDLESLACSGAGWPAIAKAAANMIADACAERDISRREAADANHMLARFSANLGEHSAFRPEWGAVLAYEKASAVSVPIIARMGGAQFYRVYCSDVAIMIQSEASKLCQVIDDSMDVRERLGECVAVTVMVGGKSVGAAVSGEAMDLKCVRDRLALKLSSRLVSAIKEKLQECKQ